MKTISDAVQELASIGSKCRIVYTSTGPHCEVIDSATGISYLINPPLDEPGAASEDDAIFSTVPLAKQADKPLTLAQKSMSNITGPVIDENKRLKDELARLQAQMAEREAAKAPATTSKPSGKSPA